MCRLSCTLMSDSLQPYEWVTHQAFLFMGFSRQKYCSGLPFPSPGDLPQQNIWHSLYSRQSLKHSIDINSFTCQINLWIRYYYYSHCTDKETSTQRH